MNFLLPNRVGKERFVPLEFKPGDNDFQDDKKACEWIGNQDSFPDLHK
ncbi:hypothetical protein [Ohtaekwangia koreensis]|nr:hypothetical protein [Ohtaekwangia koreensis]